MAMAGVHMEGAVLVLEVQADTIKTGMVMQEAMVRMDLSTWNDQSKWVNTLLMVQSHSNG